MWVRMWVRVWVRRDGLEMGGGGTLDYLWCCCNAMHSVLPLVPQDVYRRRITHAGQPTQVPHLCCTLHPVLPPVPQDVYQRRITHVLGSRSSAGGQRIAVNFAIAGQLEEFRQVGLAWCRPVWVDGWVGRRGVWVGLLGRAPAPCKVAADTTAGCISVAGGGVF